MQQYSLLLELWFDSPWPYTALVLRTLRFISRCNRRGAVRSGVSHTICLLWNRTVVRVIIIQVYDRMIDEGGCTGIQVLFRPCRGANLQAFLVALVLCSAVVRVRGSEYCQQNAQRVTYRVLAPAILIIDEKSQGPRRWSHWLVFTTVVKVRINCWIWERFSAGLLSPGITLLSTFPARLLGHCAV